MGLKDLFKKNNINMDSLKEKEEYERRVKEAQDEEFKSSRFELVVEYLKSFNTPLHKEKEEYLFSLVGRLDRDINHTGENFEKQIKTKKKEIEELNNFIFDLTDEEVNENIFLYFAKNFYLISKTDIVLPMLEVQTVALEEQYKFSYKSSYKLNLDLVNIIPDNVPLTKNFYGYGENNSQLFSEDILEDEFIEVYQSYNAFVNSIKKMFLDIYSLVLWNELITAKLPIGLKGIKLDLSNKDLIILYSFENSISMKKTYSIDHRITKIIGDKCGIPFDEMVKMAPGDLAIKLSEMDVKVLKK